MSAIWKVPETLPPSDAAPPPEEGTTVILDFVVDADMMAAFARLSGDTNPLHSDPEVARRHGFRAPVVFGGLLVAQISRLLGTRLPGPGCVWHRLDIGFRQPLHVGEPARLQARVVHASAALRLVRLDVRISAGGRVVATGTAEASLPVAHP